MYVFLISIMGSRSFNLYEVYVLIGWKLVFFQEFFESWCMVEGFQKFVLFCGYFGMMRLI